MPGFRPRVRSKRWRSTLRHHKGHLGFADHLAVHGTDPFGFADFAAGFGQFHINDECIAGPHRLAPFDVFRRHEVGDLAEIFRLTQRENARHLGDRLKLQYDPDKGMRLDSPRLQLDSAGLMPLGARSSLNVQMTYMLDHGKLVWDIGGVALSQDRDKHTFVAAYRQPKPADDAGRELRERWEHMSRRDGEFAGTAQHDNEFKNFWVRTVAGSAPQQAGVADSGSRALYEIVYNTDNTILPRQFDDIQSKLARDLKITE